MSHRKATSPVASARARLASGARNRLAIFVLAFGLPALTGVAGTAHAAEESLHWVAPQFPATSEGSVKPAAYHPDRAPTPEIATTPRTGDSSDSPLQEFASSLAEAEHYPIDLPTALQLAERKNPAIAIAREAIAENLALQQGADALLLPTLAAGANLHIHRGALQRDTGEILRVDSQSLYDGSGAGAIGGGTVGIPAVRILAPLGDAFMEPQIARLRVRVACFDARATANAVLLEVATRYVDLMGAEALLQADRQAESDLAQVVEVVRSFVKVGQARKSDLDRVQARAYLVRNEIYRAEERAAVASAQLARVLDLDPAVRFQTVSRATEPMQLVDPRDDLESLISMAVRRRPEMAARSAAIDVTQGRLKQERIRPLLPTISAGYSAGEFGGGSNLAPNRFDHFAPRSDFDVWAVWTFRNAGIGNLATQRARRVEVDEAATERVRTMNRIRDEVGEAYATSAARWRQMEITRQQLATAQSGFREELVRTRGGEGLPIEVVNSFELAAKASLDAINAVVEYDQAQLRLFVALGDPPTVAICNRPALAAAASGDPSQR